MSTRSTARPPPTGLPVLTLCVGHLAAEPDTQGRAAPKLHPLTEANPSISEMATVLHTQPFTRLQQPPGSLPPSSLVVLPSRPF